MDYFRHSGRLELYLFVCMALLFGLAGLTFRYSSIWDSNWWLWHLFCLTAYLLVLGFVVRQYLRTVSTLKATLAERKQAEEALRESEEKFRTIFESVPISMIVIDKDGIMVEVSSHQVVRTARGLTPREGYIGKSLITHPTIVGAGLSDTYRKLLEGEPFDLKDVYFPSVQRGTEGYYFNIKGVPLFKEGEVIGAITVHEEITDRKKAEDALRQSEEKFYKAFHTSPNLMTITTIEEGRIVEINEASCRIIGYERQECIGHTAAELSVWEDPDQRKRVVEKVKAEGQVSNVEVNLRTKSGQIRRLVFSMSTITLDDEKYLLSVAMDITERKRAEEALRESEERYRTLFERVPVGLYRTTPEGQVLDVNPALLEMLGFPDRETVLAANAASGYVNPENRVRWRVLMESEGVVRDFKAQWRRYDGTVVWMEESVRTVRDAEGRVLYYEGSVEDITERKQAEEELQRLYEQAQRDAETKTTLLREVNHRVRNNLVAITGLLHLEQSYARMEDQATYEAILQNLTTRLGGLAKVHSLLSASEWAPVQLSDVAGQVIKSAKQIRPRHKQVFIDVLPSPVRVTPRQAHSLALVINEIATNSIKHGLAEREEVRIGVRITLEDDVIVLEVRDDGPGYPEDVLRLERHAVGFDLIQNIVRRELQGEVSLHNDGGAVTTIRFKAE